MTALPSGRVEVEAPVPPLVSIIIINWNYGRYIGAALQSAVSQDYPALEVLAVDNGSSDDSVEVMERFALDHPAVRVIRLPANLGQLGAAHHIFETAEVRGSFVAFLDADDILFPHFVSSHLRAHRQSGRDLAVSSSNAVQIGSDGALITGQMPHFLDREVGSADAAATTVDFWTIVAPEKTGWIWYPGSSNLFRREYIETFFAVLRAPIPIPYALDTSSLPYCHSFLGSIVIGRPLSFYRCHGSNLSSTMPRLTYLEPHRQDFAKSYRSQHSWFRSCLEAPEIVAG